jgi:hypothetical protein
MRLAILRVIDDGGQLVPRDQENITCFENPCPIRLYDPGFTGNEPDQHMMFEGNFRLEEFVFITTQLDIRRYVSGFVFHECSS